MYRVQITWRLSKSASLNHLISLSQILIMIWVILCQIIKWGIEIYLYKLNDTQNQVRASMICVNYGQV